MKHHLIAFILCIVSCVETFAANKYDNPDTLFVATDSTAEFTTISDAIEVCRAFMDYHKVIFVKSGIYKEKLIIPQWLTNIEICGEDRDNTIITFDDHANKPIPGTDKAMGTFRTFTLKIEGNDITLKNITIENNSERLGQAVALHTEGDRLRFINCRILGHQDTVYTGTASYRQYFEECYIEGTTDFIFGPGTAWFEKCEIHSCSNSFITAASTPPDVPFGYVFNNCILSAEPDIDHVYLGRPWRDYGSTIFINCSIGAHILPEGWHYWEKHREQTARYSEHNNEGEGASTSQRPSWIRVLDKNEASKITLEAVFSVRNIWIP